MRIIDIVITLTVIATLVVSVAAFTMPSLLGRPIVPGLTQQAAPQLTTQALTPEDVTAKVTEETFTLTISGNIYVDKLPVEGAEVTIYLNGQRVGKATAGDLYQFQVPGVKMGDTVRVDASYEGHTGTASKVVQFKSVYLDVNIKSGRSFIRNALDMLPTKDDLNQQQTATATATPTSTPQQTSQSSSSPQTTTTSADANQLTSQVVGQTTKTLADTIGRTNGGRARPATTDTVDDGSGMNFNSLSDMMNAADVLAPTIS